MKKSNRPGLIWIWRHDWTLYQHAGMKAHWRRILPRQRDYADQRGPRHMRRWLRDRAHPVDVREFVEDVNFN